MSIAASSTILHCAAKLVELCTCCDESYGLYLISRPQCVLESCNSCDRTKKKHGSEMQANASKRSIGGNYRERREDTDTARPRVLKYKFIWPGDITRSCLLKRP